MLLAVPLQVYFRRISVLKLDIRKCNQFLERQEGNLRGVSLKFQNALPFMLHPVLAMKVVECHYTRVISDVFFSKCGYPHPFNIFFLFINFYVTTFLCFLLSYPFEKQPIGLKKYMVMNSMIVNVEGAPVTTECHHFQLVVALIVCIQRVHESCMYFQLLFCNKIVPYLLNLIQISYLQKSVSNHCSW